MVSHRPRVRYARFRVSIALMIRVTFVSSEERRLFDAFRTYVGAYIIFPNVFSTTDRQLFAQSQLAQVLLWGKQRLFTEILLSLIHI